MISKVHGKHKTTAASSKPCAPYSKLPCFLFNSNNFDIIQKSTRKISKKQFRCIYAANGDDQPKKRKKRPSATEKRSRRVLLLRFQKHILTFGPLLYMKYYEIIFCVPVFDCILLILIALVSFLAVQINKSPKSGVVFGLSTKGMGRNWLPSVLKFGFWTVAMAPGMTRSLLICL